MHNPVESPQPSRPNPRQYTGFSAIFGPHHAAARLIWSFPMALERTLSIIKPDAVAKNVIGDIYARFEKAGRSIPAKNKPQPAFVEAVLPVPLPELPCGAPPEMELLTTRNSLRPLRLNDG